MGRHRTVGRTRPTRAPSLRALFQCSESAAAIQASIPRRSSELGRSCVKGSLADIMSTIFGLIRFRRATRQGLGPN